MLSNWLLSLASKLMEQHLNLIIPEKPVLTIFTTSAILVLTAQDGRDRSGSDILLINRSLPDKKEVQRWTSFFFSEI
jgi:hypothetical protein